LFVGHNVQTTNVRKPVKGSKDSDWRLVFKLQSNNWPLVLGPGPGNLGQKGLKHTPILTSPQKLKSKTSQFFKI